ncbi:hypothetical protein BpHYR1_010085 [Brachionus plicatilis]|uniref:Uncharacterized protein n=1 Tax=Brachionus plicatilis TaxID=10195 RepID=A0A3M7QT33_BRAPC|nr:hypothetical protein BpHYR1_010085 [Brachionus plicatilis]
MNSTANQNEPDQSELLEGTLKLKATILQIQIMAEYVACSSYIYWVRLLLMSSSEKKIGKKRKLSVMDVNNNIKRQTSALIC